MTRNPISGDTYPELVPGRSPPRGDEDTTDPREAAADSRDWPLGTPDPDRTPSGDLPITTRQPRRSTRRASHLVLAPPPPPAEAETGRVLCERYLLGRRMATGDVGAVFAATDLRLEKSVAIQVLSPQIEREGPHLVGFRREAVAASQISHDGIVRVSDFDRDRDGTPFLVMERLDGRPLAQLIEATGALPVRRALVIAVQIASALDAAHRSGIVHRDLRPGNVFLTTQDARGDAVKLIDFGGARLRPPVPGAIDGDPAVDVRALGAILYETLVGAPPGARPGPPSARRAVVPVALDRVVERALATDPATRFPSMAAMSAALIAVLARVDPVAAATIGADGADDDGASPEPVDPTGPTMDIAAVPDARAVAPRPRVGLLQVAAIAGAVAVLAAVVAVLTAVLAGLFPR